LSVEGATVIDRYATSVQHLLAELERIDVLIRAQVALARRVSAADDEFQGFYISEQAVDALLAQPGGLLRWATNPAPSSQPEVQTALDRMACDIARRKAESVRRGSTLRLDELARLFELTPFDIDALLVCLAPELDLRYERLYAYLQDDVTKRRPSLDLVLSLLCPSFEAKLEARQRFTPQAALLKHHLLYLFDDPSHQQPPLLSKYLKVDERVVNYLLGSDELDARLQPYAKSILPGTHLDALLLPDDLKRRLAQLARNQKARGDGLVIYFEGPYGVGKQTTAQALGRELGVGLLVVDGERLLGVDEASFITCAKLIRRETLLQGAALYWTHFDALLADDRRAWREILLRELKDRRGLTFLAGESAWEPADAWRELPFVRIEFTRPSYAERIQLWTMSLDGNPPCAADVDVEAVATKFRFTGGQIRDAAATAGNMARWRDPANGQVTMADLYAACRLQSNRKLTALARKITPRYTWNDIVLPPDRLEQLREISNTVKYRSRVYGEWGFDRKLTLGKGLAVLFAGPSGTGKTMAAEIMAGELNLDLYKIDLSTVVSKYIGETEKNLARIFAEAETSNAILFFDEADALFGKRSEVRDAHDRYANIEIAYLLQKMDEYEGVVILATNLRKNMDDAFVRRLQFTVEFPIPTEVDRRHIWERIWPHDTPKSSDLDLGFMARRFEFAGGNIRNIAVAATFLAAANGGTVNMAHLIRATKREYQKMGKIVAAGEFGEYAGLAVALK
jgi:SpoVK/Ycf46/Vps4 family AAA+-type ATPase